MYFTFNRHWLRGGVLLWLAAATHLMLTVRASTLDTIGVTLLHSVTTNLNGTGVRVAQPEGDVNTNQPPTFEVNPAATSQPASLFTYYSSIGSRTNYPNSVGGESGHAEQVAGSFYGIPGGVATNVAHVDNYDANNFLTAYYDVYTNLHAFLPSTNIDDPVVNQSFIFSSSAIADQQALDACYDTYAAQYRTLFVSGAGNGGAVHAPSTCYNGISVGAYGGSSSIGPTRDNGRAKPDIVAPAGATSFSTPLVSGAAAMLLQAAVRGDGGTPTNFAADIRTLKALLLNGAIKPADWTNGPSSPLDARYGAGVLNVFNSYEQLASGRHPYIASNSVPVGNPHPPTGAGGTVSKLSGWDFNTNASSSTVDGVNHYYFNVTNGLANAAFTATATLVWNRQTNQTSINNLDLFLYDANSSNLIASCASAVDNVEHLFVTRLPQGRYDLQVLKHGGTFVSAKEAYALAFEFFSMSLDIAPSGTNAVITWPIYPTGFVLESAPGLQAPIVWTTNNPSPVVSNGLERVTVDASSDNQLFRIRRP